jgi:hypothetical protein
MIGPRMLVRSSLPPLFLLSLVAPSCDVYDDFYMYHNLVPNPGCVISPSGDLYRARGTLDVFAGEGYVLFPLMVNDLPVRKPGSDLSSRIEPNFLQLHRYEVTLRPPPSLSFMEELVTTNFNTSGGLNPGGDMRASYTPVLSDELATKLRDENLVGEEPIEFIAEVTAFAEDGIKREISAQPFIYPINVCLGCLTLDLGFCSSTPTDAASRFGNTCGLPQDEGVGCCRNDDGSRFCFQKPAEEDSLF